MTAVDNQAGIQLFRDTGIERALNLRINFELWSPSRLVEVAQNSDICVIPSDRKSSAKSGASSNRLITAIALGLPTAAEVLPSYSEFRPYFADIRTNEFTDILHEPQMLHERILEAQTNIVTGFTKRVIGANWLKIFQLYLSRV